MALKWNFTSEYDLQDSQMQKIISFFLIETPVSNVSVRSVTFRKRGIDMRRMPNAIKKAIPELHEFWIEGRKDEIGMICRKIGVENNVTLPIQFAIHTNSRNTKTESLYYAIRCAFAHGSFAIHTFNKEKYYLLENKDKNVLKARIVLKESSLIELINLVEKNSRGNYEH